MMRYDQQAYYRKYGTSVIYDYAPKSDTIAVIIFLLAIGSAISWFFQKQHWQNVADKLIKATVEDLSPREGGTPESKDLRDRALVILAEREAKEDDNTDKAAKKKAIKLTATEKRKATQEALRPIIVELVNQIEDFGAGYHKPTWKDLMVVKLAYLPMSLASGIWWNVQYGINRLSGKELSDDEREVLTRRAIGEVNWHSASEEDRAKFLTMDLWKPGSMAEWEEEREIAKLSVGDQKRYKRMQKRGNKEE
jgi:DnaJ homolog subfamily C member 25